MTDQKDNVKVAIRVRPLNDRERSEASKLSVSIPDLPNTILLDIKSEQKPFTFDYVAPESITQSVLFEKIGKPIADSCLSGYNSTIFAYGQTGAGKTFTILGPDPSTTLSEASDRGLLPRCVEYIFTTIQEQSAKKEINFLIKCSYLEIYQEQINDLLDPNPQSLQLREDMKRGVYVEGLIEEVVNDLSETRDWIRIGTENRHVGSTSMNKESSRSHSVFTLVVESKVVSSGMNKFITSRFHLIDLAGSERQKATDCAGERLKEAGMINKSLSALGNVINSLVDISEGKSRHIHYRDSKLTFLLKDSLGGNSKTCIIANISPAFSAANETLSTLKFAQRAKQIKNSAYINEETSGAVNVLQFEIRRLKEELQGARNAAVCYKCSCVSGGEEGDSVYEVLYKVVKSKQENFGFFASELERKESFIENLKKAVVKLENKANHDKMVLKFRDATIARLHSNAPDIDKEVIELKQEIEILREQVENNPNVAKLYVENEKLRNCVNDEKAVAAYVERITELEGMLAELAENFKDTVEQLTCEKEEARMGLIQKIKELEDRFDGKKMQKLSFQVEGFEREKSELERKIHDMQVMLHKAQEENNSLLLKNETDLEAKIQIELYNFELQEKVESLQKLSESSSKCNQTYNEYEEKLRIFEISAKKQEEKFKEEYDLLSINYKDLQSQFNLLSMSNIDFQNEFTLMSSQYTEMKTKYNSINIQFIQLQEENNALKSKIAAHELNIDELKKSCEATKLTLEHKSELLCSLETALKEKNEKYLASESLMKEKNDLIDYYSVEMDRYAVLEQEHYKLLDKLKLISDKNEALSLSLQTTKHQLDESTKQNNLLTSELSLEAASAENYQKLLSDHKVLQEKLIDQEKQLKNITFAKNDSEQKLIESVFQQQELENSLETLKAEYIKIRQEITVKPSKNEISHLENQAFQENESKSLIEDLTQQVKLLQDELKQTKSGLENFQELNLGLTQKNAELSNSLGKMHSSHIPLYIAEQLRRELTEKNEEVLLLKEENKQKVEILKTTKQSIASTKIELASWKKCIDDKNQVIQDLKTELRRLREDQAENAEVVFLRKNLYNKEKELKELKDKGQEYYSQADEALEKMRKKCMAYQNEVNVLRAENKDLVSAAAYKMGAIRETDEVSVKREDLLSMKNINKKLSEELRMTRETNEALQKQNCDLVKRVTEETLGKRQLEEESFRLADGFRRLAGLVYSLPSAKSNPQENSVIESIRRTISQVTDLKPTKKQALSELNNFTLNN